MELHSCRSLEEPYHANGRDKRWQYGAAIETCSEYDDGTLWVDNEEYGSPVNFCPFCGYKAKVSIKVSISVA